MKYNDYVRREVKKETEKAYLVEVVERDNFGSCKQTFKWVAKSVCKDFEKNEIKVSDSYTFTLNTVLVPTTFISSGRFSK